MPAWDDLWELAESRDGLFHVQEARGLGITDQAIYGSSRIERVEDFRGVHRFKRAPTSQWFLYNAAFVWSRENGVISHGSALEVWKLSDWVSHHAEMTLPTSWKVKSKKNTIPTKILAFFADLPGEDVQDFEGFRVTTARRSVDDFILWGIRPDLARQAVEQATSRGRPGGALFHRNELRNRHLLRG